MTSGGGESPTSPTRFSTALHAIGHATLWVERPVRRVVGPGRFNPLPHAGTISVFLLGVVVLSGLYITLFFEFGYAASYESVAAMEDNALQRVMRALHRYSSAMLVLTTVVHGWRIFAAQRFTGRRRRWNWATGVASLVLVWLAGVTGYWLVWDRRAAALNEATTELLRSFDAGTRFAIRNLVGVSPGSGSDFLLFIWFVHLGLTAVIGWFTYRHLRNSKLPWLPTRHWMALMGGGLLLLSVIVPVGMLGPARPDQLVAGMPLDPFIMFLLPPLLSSYSWPTAILATVLLAAVALLPRLLARSDPPAIVIDEQACTGCELCVVDCPYNALVMGRGAPAATNPRSIAIVDPGACVACGICLGSCAFEAIALPGWTPTAPDVAGSRVVVACSRHLDDDGKLDLGEDHTVISVRCAGMFEPNAVRGFIERGALGVQLVGCAPDDCRFGVGNTLADERMRSERSPHPPRRFADRIATDWVDPSDLRTALEHPGSTRHDEPDESLRARIVSGAGLLISLSIVGVVFATRAPFRTDESIAAVRVIVDHEAGAVLQEVEASPGAIDWIEVRVDGSLLGRHETSKLGPRSIGLADWTLDPGMRSFEVRAGGDDGSVVLFAEESSIAPLQRLVITATDVPPAPGAAEGRDVFGSRAAGCQICHSIDRGEDGVGPSLFGIGSTAAIRVEGLDAEQYLRQSILLPDQFIVDGWPSGQMLPIYRERLTEIELDALITYLLTLDGPEQTDQPLEAPSR